ncbi:MAG: 4-alpha-glucanotransferase [Geodermatophilaceae bacterium]
MNLSPEQTHRRACSRRSSRCAAKPISGSATSDRLREFIDWAAGVGFKLVQLLPINETGGDNSPYNAISAMAIEPTTPAPCAPVARGSDAAGCFSDEVLGRFNLKQAPFEHSPLPAGAS